MRTHRNPLAAPRLRTLSAALATCWLASAGAQPQHPQVVSGSASISQQSG